MNINQKFNYRPMLSNYDFLKSYAYSLTRDRTDAEDLVQETFLRAIQNKDKFAQGSNIKAWMFTIMKNTFINNYHKQNLNHAAVDTSKELNNMKNEVNTEKITPESIVSSHEIIREIKNLKDEQRIPFEMHFEGYKYKEIADELNLSIGTIKSRIFFSRKKLMSKFHDMVA
jgi:RNA polymerase sigma-70 factor, ECF subfamily